MKTGIFNDILDGVLGPVSRNSKMQSSFLDLVKKLMKLSTLLLVINIIVIMDVNKTGATAESSVIEKMKYVLQWSKNTVSPFNFMGIGRAAFIKNNCKYTNCFVTDDSSYLNIEDFDAIVFNGRNVINMKPFQLPPSRSPKQKYVFAGTESADRFPVCKEFLDGFFNWTWTYKLSSDFRFGYITTYDLEGIEVGPAIDMKWIESMDPIDEDLKAKLAKKSKTAAIFISDCKTNNRREDFIKEINEELKKYGLNVDVYGSCGNLTCAKSQWRECNKKIQEDYFFYLAFENSFAEDYVTEKLLMAMNNYAVPVVYGIANYSRFLPPGSFLDATKLSAKNLVRVMNELMSNRNKYHDLFRWRNHYTYSQTLMNADICKLCEVLNDDQMVNTPTVWTNFREWWNVGSHVEKCP